MSPEDSERLRRMAESATPEERERMLRLAEIIAEQQQSPAARVAVIRSAGVIREVGLDETKFPDFG